jgi:hypothetical protein
VTYEALQDEAIERTFPEGVAENLDTIYRKRVLDGLIELQRWCPYFKARQFKISPFSTTLFRQGTSYICSPSGLVKRVATYTDESLSDIVYYDQATREDLDRIQQARSRTLTYPEGDAVSVGYFAPTPDTDKQYRAERGIFVVDNRQIAIHPHIESGENILVEWDGIVRTFEDADAVDLGDFEPQCIDILSLYLRKEAALREDRNTSDYAAITLRWRQAVAALKLDTKEANEPESLLSDIGILPRPYPSESEDYASNVGEGNAYTSSGEVDPEGAVAGCPGNTYLNTVTETVWMKKTGDGTNTGWIQVIG